MRTIGAVLFPGFQLLDLYGPLDLFSMLDGVFDIRLVAQTNTPVAAGAGPRAMPDTTFAEAGSFDILLVPGGPGTRPLVTDAVFIDDLHKTAQAAEIVATVCTGSALLACTGMLDGRRATTNKAAFDWVAGQRPQVDWQRRARWVEDGDILTSSGVSAGMDMALALIARLHDREPALEAARSAEYRWSQDAGDDPFAVDGNGS